MYSRVIRCMEMRCGDEVYSGVFERRLSRNGERLCGCLEPGGYGEKYWWGSGHVHRGVGVRQRFDKKQKSRMIQ